MNHNFEVDAVAGVAEEEAADVVEEVEAVAEEEEEVVVEEAVVEEEDGEETIKVAPSSVTLCLSKVNPTNPSSLTLQLAFQS